MCGIAGIITENKSFDPKSTVNQMLLTIKHRGPDNTSMHCFEDTVFLGFNRLSIVDLSVQANQPLYNEDRSMALVANGEIYNYVELRQRLIGLGHTFNSHSDAETILHAYEQWKESCLDQLRGMFAFAIWNSKTRKLFLARDRIGIKPLYYLLHKESLFFASELKAFTAISPEYWQTRLNKNVVNIYFSFPYINDNVNTLLEGVKKLPPGHYAYFKEGILDIRRYWSLEKKDSIPISYEEAVDRTEEMLKEVIDSHLIGDVPIALMLTGGLDSSVIAALALKCEKKIACAITVGHQGFKFDERKYGKLVASHLGIKHIEMEVDPKQAAQDMEKFVWYFDDLSIIGFFYQIFISQQVQKLGFKSVLLGEGSDEIFGGYHIFKLSMLPFSLLPSRIWNMLYYNMLTAKKFGLDYFKNTELIDKPVFSAGLDVHKRCTLFEIYSQLPNYNLMADDKGYMSHSIEARVPYLDHKLVEFVFNLPQAYKLKGRLFTRKHEVVKHILRSIALKYLPPEIAFRKKQGMGLSMLEIISSNKPKVRDYLLSANSLALSLFSRSKVESVVNNEALDSRFLSRLYVLEIWARQYLSQKKPAQTS